MRKSTIGETAPVAGGSHFSDRSKIQPATKDRIHSLVGTAEILAGKGARAPDLEPDTGYGRADPADMLESTDEGSSSKTNNNANSKTPTGAIERKRRNRRPGNRALKVLRQIEYPPKPNRRHQGLPVPGPGEPGTRGGSNRRLHKQHRHNKTRVSDPLYAALDLGTNNCRLLVAFPQQAGKFRVVDAFSRIVRLGKGLENTGRLDEKAMDRAVEALVQCSRKIRGANITSMRLIATEACRRAENGSQFLERVKNETGLELEIINRKTEAQLAAEGCCALVDRKADGAVLFDIGGGSSELILLDRRGKKKKQVGETISSWTSLPVGVVTLSERHGGKHVSRKMFDAMMNEVLGHIARFEGRNRLSEFWNNGRVHLLGTSGTVTTLAGVHLKLPRYDRRQVDGIWLKDGQIDDVIEQLIEMDFEQRAANPCIGRERADLVLAGCAILQAIRMTWPSPRLRVADRGLREGILTQLMNQDGAWNKKNNNSERPSRRRNIKSANSRSENGSVNG